MVSCSFGAFLVIFRALDEKEKLKRDVSDKEKKNRRISFYNRLASKQLENEMSLTDLEI